MTASITHKTALSLVTEAMRLTAEMEPAQLHVLLLVAAAPTPMMMTDLARARGKTTASMTATVDQLVKRGLVTRQSDGDRRVIRVVITAAGIERVSAIANGVAEILNAGGCHD